MANLDQDQTDDQARPAEPAGPSTPSTANYDQFPQPEKPIRNWTRVFSIAIGIVVLLALGAGGYWLFNNHKTAKPQPTTAKTTQTTQASKTPASEPTKTYAYSSPTATINFDYPASWTVTDPSGGQPIATSPTTSFKDAAGQTTSGKIVFSIKTSATTLSGFSAGNAAAVLASQKIAYTQPSQTQRGSTYLSFLTYASTKSSTGLDAIYITGNNGYLQGQAIPQADLVQVSPIINLTFLDSSGKATTIGSSNWGDPNFSTPLLKMLESLALS